MTRLADPLTIKKMHLRNRLALPPITTNFGTAEGEVTPDILGFYRQRAKDVGLVIAEATTVRSDGRITPFSLGLWKDSQIKGMAALAKTIKDQGAAAAVQLGHAGARGFPVSDGIRGASPSGVALRSDVEPTVLTEEQIGEIVEDFVAAGVRSREAGMDGVEIHAAHFYLLSQFLSPLTNKRTDRYGGDIAGRASIAVEVVRGLRKKLGDDFAILVRMNAVEAVDGGLQVSEAVAAARLLEAAGADAIHASLVAVGSWREADGRRYLQGSSALPKDRPMGANLPVVAEIKRAVRVPVIAVGKLGDSAESERAVAEGLADIVAIGRQMIADPRSAGMILSGRADEMVPCGECMACFASIGKGVPVVCGTNRNLAGDPQYAPAR